MVVVIYITSPEVELYGCGDLRRASASEGEETAVLKLAAAAVYSLPPVGRF